MFSKKGSSFVHTVVFRLTLLFVALFALLLIAVLIPIDVTLQSTMLNRLDAKIVRQLGDFSYYGGLFARKTREEAVGIIVDNLGWAAAVDGREDVLWLLVSDRGEVVTSSDTQSWQPALETILATIPALPARGESSASVSSEPPAVKGTFYVETGGVKQIAALETRRLPGKSDRFRAAFMKYENGMVLINFHSLAAIDREMAKYRKVLGIAFTGVLLLGGGLGFLTTRHAMQGVQRVTQTALAIGQGDLGRRVTVGRQGREIAEMAAAFNEMLSRMQTLIKGLKEVTTNIAHDLRSPITTIRGLAEATLSGQSVDADAATTFGTIVAECDRLIGMINAMLEIAELDSGLAPIPDTAVDIGNVAQAAYELFQPVAEDKGVRLACDTDGSASVTVRGNLAGLQRALANLLDNAIKFTPSGGDVKLSVHANQQVMVQVADTGMGIDPQILPHIFECFYRAERSRSTAGNGLGLSLAQSVVRAHGGAIAVESTPGVGSMFTVTLPRCS